MHLKYVEQLPPRVIAKRLDVTTHEIHMVDQRLKKNFIKEKEGKPKPKKHLSKREASVGIGIYLEEQGIHGLKRRNVQEYLKKVMPDTKVPSLNNIGSLLKEKFKLRYGRFDGAVTKYADPKFDPKRLWVARLLT